MYSKPRSCLILAGLGFFLAVVSAQAANVSIVAGINRYHPSTNPDPPAGSSYAPKSAFDLGVLVDFPISEQYRFESGMIRHTRTTLLEDAVTTTESSYRGVLVPLTFRFMRAEFLGFGFGPYLAFLNADENLGIKSFEMGLRASLRVALPISGDFKALFDASYLIGVTDLNKSPTAEDKNQELLFLLGIQFPLSSLPTPTGEKS